VVVTRDENFDDDLARKTVDTARQMSLSADVAAISDPRDRLESKLSACNALIFVHGSVSVDMLCKHFQDCSAVIRRRPGPMPTRAFLLGPPAKQSLRFDHIDVEVIDCADEFHPQKIRDFLVFLPRRED
jgi:hypothetical protein